MKRLLTLLLNMGWLVTAAYAQDDPKPQPSARLVALEVTLAEFDPSLWAANDPSGSKLLASLRAVESQEKVYSFAQIRLSALEHQQAMAQWGERVAVPSGRTVTSSSRAASGGFAPAGASPGGIPTSMMSYTRENTGSIVSATCRIDEGGLIVVELNLEQSRLAADGDVKLDPSDPDASVLLKPVTKTVKTAVSVADGQTVALGGMLQKSGKQLRQDAILITAHILGATPVKVMAKEAPLPAVAKAESPDLFRRSAERMLQQLDRNGNGVLEASELRLVSESRAASPLPRDADQNGDGQITVEELTKALSVRSPREELEGRPATAEIDDRTRRYAETKMKQYDKDGNGTLNAAELRSYSNSPSGADNNGDGQVTLDELIKAFAVH